MGYKIRKFVLPDELTTKTFNMGKVWLAPDPKLVDEVVVRTRMKMYEQYGDTLRVYSRAVKTLKGDALIEILKQIPGITVASDGSVSVDGKPVERTYLNDKLIFGDDKITALYKIDADETTTVDIYEEEAYDDITFNQKRKRKVMNIKTKTNINRYYTLDFIAEGGRSNVKEGSSHRDGYLGELELGRFDEKTQTNVKLSHGNIGYKANGYGAILHSNGISSGPKSSLYATYTYNMSMFDRFSLRVQPYKDRTYSSREIVYEYLPTKYFDTQTITQSSEKYDDHKVMYLSADCSKSSGNVFKYRLQINSMLSNLKSQTYESQNTVIDGVETTSTNRSFDKDDKGVDLKLIFSGSFNVGSKNYLDLGVESFYKNDKGDEYRDTEIKNDKMENRSVLSIEKDAPNWQINSSLRFGHNFSENRYNTWSVSSRESYTKEHSERYDYAVDEITGQLDDVYSGDYVMDAQTFATSVTLSTPYLSKGSASLSLVYRHTQLGQDQYLPISDKIDKSFDMFAPTLSIRIKNGPWFDLSTTQTLPSLTQFSRVLNTENPRFNTIE